MNKSIPGTQAIVRALRILKLFLGEDAELSLAQITKQSGLNRTTAFRLVQVLEAEGMLKRVEPGARYRLGTQIADLGRRARGWLFELPELAQPEIDALAEVTRETVTLEVMREGRVLVVAEAGGRHVVGTVPCVGRTWPTHATATGKVLLAALGAEGWRRVLAGRLTTFTENTISSRDALERELARVASRGHAFNLEELEPDFVTVAVPVSDGQGGAVAALSVGGPKARLRRRRLAQWVPELEGAARRITQRCSAYRPDLGSAATWRS